MDDSVNPGIPGSIPGIPGSIPGSIPGIPGSIPGIPGIPGIQGIQVPLHIPQNEDTPYLPRVCKCKCVWNPNEHTCSRLYLFRLFKSLCVIAVFLSSCSIIFFFYALTFTLPSCGLNVHVTPIPFSFATSGISSYISDITFAAVLQSKTYSDLQDEGYKSIKASRSSIETVEWLGKDFLDATHHLLFFSNPKDILARRKRRAVESLPLKTIDDLEIDILPKFKKWSNRKVTNSYRKILYQVERNTKPPKWLKQFKHETERKKMLQYMTTISMAEQCLSNMPWWSLPTNNPDGSGRNIRILLVWGTTVIAFLGVGIFMVANEYEEDERRRQRGNGGGNGNGNANFSFGTNGSFSTLENMTDNDIKYRTELVNASIEEVVETDTTIQCSICFELMNLTPTSELICGHHFHTKCIEQWLVFKVRSDCPLCRRVVVQKANLRIGRQGNIEDSQGGVLIPVPVATVQNDSESDSSDNDERAWWEF